MNRAEIIEGLKEIHDRFYAFTDYRKTTEACLNLLENENALIDRVLEIIAIRKSSVAYDQSKDYKLACDDIEHCVLELRGDKK